MDEQWVLRALSSAQAVYLAAEEHRNQLIALATAIGVPNTLIFEALGTRAWSEAKASADPHEAQTMRPGAALVPPRH